MQIIIVHLIIDISNHCYISMKENEREVQFYWERMKEAFIGGGGGKQFEE